MRSFFENGDSSISRIVIYSLFNTFSSNPPEFRAHCEREFPPTLPKIIKKIGRYPDRVIFAKSKFPINHYGRFGNFWGLWKFRPSPYYRDIEFRISHSQPSLGRSPYFSRQSIYGVKNPFSLFAKLGFPRKISFASGIFWSGPPLFPQKRWWGGSPISEGPISGGYPSWVQQNSKFPRKFGIHNVAHGPKSNQIKSNQLISYHIISYRIISYHILSYHIRSYHIISYHIISYHTQ